MRPDTQIHVTDRHISVKVGSGGIDRSDIRSRDLKPHAVTLEDLDLFSPGQFHCRRRFEFRENPGIEHGSVHCSFNGSAAETANHEKSGHRYNKMFFLKKLPFNFDL